LYLYTNTPIDTATANNTGFALINNFIAFPNFFSPSTASLSDSVNPPVLDASINSFFAVPALMLPTKNDDAFLYATNPMVSSAILFIKIEFSSVNVAIDLPASTTSCANSPIALESIESIE